MDTELGIHHSLALFGRLRDFPNVLRVFDRSTPGRISLSSRFHLGSISVPSRLKPGKSRLHLAGSRQDLGGIPGAGGMECWVIGVVEGWGEGIVGFGKVREGWAGRGRSRRRRAGWAAGLAVLEACFHIFHGRIVA